MPTGHCAINPLCDGEKAKVQPIAYTHISFLVYVQWTKPQHRLTCESQNPLSQLNFELK